MERDQPFDLEIVGRGTRVGELSDGLANDAFGRTPAQERDSSVRGPEKCGRRQERQDPVHLAHPLLVDGLTLVRVRELVTDEHAVLVVLIGGHDVDVSGGSRHRARRDATLGDAVALEAAVHRRLVTVEADDVAAVDGHVEVQLGGIAAGSAFGQQQVGEDDARTLELVDQVEELRDDLEAIDDVGRRDDDPRVVSLAGAQHLPEIALFGLGGHTRGRSCPLHVDADDGDLHHGRRAEGLAHERKPATRGRAHDAAARVRRPDRHVDHADLVLDLSNHDAELTRVPRHPVQHA